MVFGKLNRPLMLMWLITISSKQKLLNRDRDFIADLLSEEARKTIRPYSFILHDIIESKEYSKTVIEATKTALRNLLLVLKDNLPYKITYNRL